MAAGRDRQEGAVLSAVSLGRDVPEGASLLLDTSTVIAYLEPERSTAVAAAVIDDFVHSGRNHAVVSTVTMMEALVGPLRATDVGLAERILEFFELFPNVELRAADALVARQAASLRARLGLAGADALILATGLVAGCGRIVTNDREWSTKLSQLRWSGATASVVLLDDHLPFPE